GGGNPGCPQGGSGGSTAQGAWGGGTCTSTSSNWSDSANWSSGAAPSGPQSVAEFGASQKTTINFDTTATVGTLQFNSGAPAYTFNIGSPYSLTLAAAGIRNLSTSIETFNVSGKLNFLGGASAGNAALVAMAGGTIDFSGVTAGTPTAGSIAGAGTFFLGRNTLEVGSLNTSTTLSGGIQDGSTRGGSLKKVGTGTLTLTGRNVYTGNTTIAGVMEVLGGGRIEGTSSITVADQSAQTGALRVGGAQSSVTTPGNIVIGNAGRGALSLEDGAVVNAASVLLGSAAGSVGTLNLGTGGIAGVLNVTSVVGGSGSGSAVNINQSQSAYTISANLLGTLTVNHAGTGTTTLTGTNGYSGGTNLNAGTIRIGANTNLGSATSALNFNGGTLQSSATITNFTHPVSLGSRGGTLDTGAFSVTVTGALSGAGRLTKVGAGTLTLNGPSTYSGGTTVSNGTLRGTSASLAGNIVNNASVAFLQVSNGIYSGVMSGSGTLTKFNAADLELSGVNTFTGGTAISSGTLTVSGSLASAVVVGQSGTLSGAGTIDAPVSIAGVIAPGRGENSIGTLTVRNNVSFGNGSLYRVDAESSGRADRIDISGAATIGESAVDVVASPAGTWNSNTRYTIVSATGGVSGQFADVGTDLAFLTPSLSYDRNNIYLTLTRNDAGFSSASRTRKQSVTAHYLEALDEQSGDGGATQAVVRSVTMSSVEQARNLFDQIGGAELTRLARVSSANTAKIADLLVRRLSGQGLWMQSLSIDSEEYIRADGESRAEDSYEWRHTGVIAGFDAALNEDMLLGLGVGFSRGDVALNERGETFARASTAQAMLYGKSMNGPVQFNGVVGYALPQYRTERRLSLLGRAPAAASHSARELSLYAEAALTGVRGGIRSLQPLIAVRFVQSAEGSYTESGSTGSLAVMGRTSQSLASEVGARFVRELTGADGSLELRAAWSHGLNGDPSLLTARLASDVDGGAFTVPDISQAQNRLLMDLKLTAQLRRDFAFHLDCNVDAPVGASPQTFLRAGLSRVW
ncbi:MAG: autotransporter domain-containing protein, partial [Gammaproteobacteria bacterium]